MRYVCPTCDREYPENLGTCPDDHSPLVEFAEKKGDPLIGSTIDGRFKIERMLGQGGMGAVYLGQQTSIGREVAVKVMRGDLGTDEDAVKRFYREAKVVSRLAHPNIVNLIDFGRTPDGVLYLAMEFVRGSSLTSQMTRPMPLERTVHIIGQVCDALSEAHAKGVVHRDLKPDNILLTSQTGRADVVKVLDFGVAKISRGEGGTSISALTAAGFIVGTPQYMSPEQIGGEGGKLTHRSDLYSLAVITFEMLAGTPPFRADTPLGVLVKHLGEQPPRVRQMRAGLALPIEVEEFLDRNLSKNAADRAADAQQFKLDLANAAKGEPLVDPSVVDEEAEAQHPTAVRQAILSSDTLVAGAADAGQAAATTKAAQAPARPSSSGKLATAAITQPRALDLHARQQLEDAATVALDVVPVKQTTASMQAPAASARRRTGLFIGIGAAMVAGIVAVIVLVGRGGGESTATTGAAKAEPAAQVGAPAKAADPTPAPVANRATATPAAPAPAPVPAGQPSPAQPSTPAPSATPASVLVRSNPSGADIVIDDKVVGKTPSTVEVPAGKDSVRATLRLDGFADHSVEVLRFAVATGGHSVDLVPAKKAAPAPRALVRSPSGPRKPPPADGPKKPKKEDFGLE